MKELLNTKECEVIPKVYIRNLINKIDDVLNKKLYRKKTLEEIVFDKKVNQDIECKEREKLKEKIIKNKVSENKENEEIEDPFTSAIADWEREQEETVKNKRYGFGLNDDELPPFDNISSEFVIDDEIVDAKEEEIFFPDDNFAYKRKN